MTFTYPAVFTPHEDGKGYHAVFPDLECCEADGPDLEDTIENARDAACNWITVEMDEFDSDLPFSTHVEDMDQYDTILLGYPNWWASIPMPVASFLEEYDFSGKTIIPFCSHGGGRFGQSLTAITKLVPDALLGEGLAVSYSGGSSLSNDVTAWLDENNLPLN